MAGFPRGISLLFYTAGCVTIEKDAQAQQKLYRHIRYTAWLPLTKWNLFYLKPFASQLNNKRFYQHDADECTEMEQLCILWYSAALICYSDGTGGVSQHILTGISVLHAILNHSLFLFTRATKGKGLGLPSGLSFYMALGAAFDYYPNWICGCKDCILLPAPGTIFR